MISANDSELPDLARIGWRRRRSSFTNRAASLRIPALGQAPSSAPGDGPEPRHYYATAGLSRTAAVARQAKGRTRPSSYRLVTGAGANGAVHCGRRAAGRRRRRRRKPVGARLPAQRPPEPRAQHRRGWPRSQRLEADGGDSSGGDPQPAAESQADGAPAKGQPSPAHPAAAAPWPAGTRPSSGPAVPSDARRDCRQETAPAGIQRRRHREPAGIRRAPEAQPADRGPRRRRRAGGAGAAADSGERPARPGAPPAARRKCAARAGGAARRPQRPRSRRGAPRDGRRAGRGSSPRRTRGDPTLATGAGPWRKAGVRAPRQGGRRHPSSLATRGARWRTQPAAGAGRERAGVTGERPASRLGGRSRLRGRRGGGDAGCMNGRQTHRDQLNRKPVSAVSVAPRVERTASSQSRRPGASSKTIVRTRSADPPKAETPPSKNGKINGRHLRCRQRSTARAASPRPAWIARSSTIQPRAPAQLRP